MARSPFARVADSLRFAKELLSRRPPQSKPAPAPRPAPVVVTPPADVFVQVAPAVSTISEMPPTKPSAGVGPVIPRLRPLADSAVATFTAPSSTAPQTILPNSSSLASSSAWPYRRRCCGWCAHRCSRCSAPITSARHGRRASLNGWS